MPTSKKRLDKIIFSLIAISLVCSVFTFTELNILQFGPKVLAQISNSDAVQIISTSTYTDDLGAFHIIGEVNNTSTQSQTDVVITAILSDTTNNTVVGNHTAFSSISTLRHGEFSPFDIVIQNPQQILGNFDFLEFSATSQPAVEEKPANLVINGTSSFLDNSGNPHIMGNIINQGQTPEQFLNLVATYYDNSSLGIIGTQTFGLNVENLANNQMAPFDITITDNKTKSQGAFYSLNVESTQSSMSAPLNTKISFVSTGGFATSGGDILANNFPINNQPGFVNSNDDDSNTRDNDDDDDNDNDDNQRGEKKTDDEGNPWFDDDNCSEESGSSGGSSSECEEAEREEESERDDEDSLEKDQDPPSNSDSSSDSTNNNNDESGDDIQTTNEDDKIEDDDGAEDDEDEDNN